MNQITIRSLQDNDMPFIFSSWLQSYKQESAFAKRIKDKVFYFWHRRVIESILSRTSTKVIVAHVIDEPDVILAYLIYESLEGVPKVIHYTFVKPHFRRMGIAKALVKHANLKPDIYFTHFTYSAEPIVNPREDFIYDPYRI